MQAQQNHPQVQWFPSARCWPLQCRFVTRKGLASAAAPQFQSPLGFPGCHIPVHVVWLSLVLIRAPRWGQMCCSGDLLLSLHGLVPLVDGY